MHLTGPTVLQAGIAGCLRRLLPYTQALVIYPKNKPGGNEE